MTPELPLAPETARRTRRILPSNRDLGSGLRLCTGNEAVAYGALAAGLRFFAGYPITPSSEIAEVLAKLLPKQDCACLNMEDEIASISAIIGASLTGAKSMTATSGPGFSLMQENLGFAAMAEVPCVIVNVMRGGPSTGMPTMLAQADLMQARWGTHGDHPIIALTPYTVLECYTLTVRAFALAETYRTPVVLLLDELLGHINERVEFPETVEMVERARPTVPPEDFLPYQATRNGVPPMADFGEGYRTHVTGLVHDQAGFPTNDHGEIDKLIRRLHRKIEQNRASIIEVHEVEMEDAEIGVVAYGCSARSAHDAVRSARREGIRAGLFRPRTIWPFPDVEIRAACDNGTRKWLAVEMALGQLSHEVEWAVGGRGVVSTLQRCNGSLMHPLDILNELRRLSL